MRSLATLIFVLIGLNCYTAEPDEADGGLNRLRRDLKSTNWEARDRALLKAKEKGEKGKSLLPELCSLAVDKSPKTRKAALEAIEVIDPNLYAIVLPIVVDDQSLTRQANLRKLADLGDDGQPAIAIVIELLKSGNRFEAASALNTLVALSPGDDRVIKAVLDVVSKDPNLRTVGIALIPKLKRSGESVKKYVSVLTDNVKGDGEGSVAAINALATFKEAAKSAIPVLKVAKGARSEAVRSAAALALKEIEEAVEKKDDKQERK